MYDIIVNPTAGNGKALKAMEIVKNILIKKNIEFTIILTKGTGNASEIVRELNQKPETNIIAMGGDGTFSEILNGITDFTTITVGFIPCGSGNDFIKALKIPKKTEEALDLILQNNKQYCDYIDVNTRKCLNCIGAGLDVSVLEKVETISFLKGKIKYYFALVSELTHIKFHKMRLILDGVIHQKEVFMIALANGCCMGGGMKFSPLSDVQDGFFDVIVINKLPKFKIPFLLFSFLSGRHLTKKCTEHFRAQEITVMPIDCESHHNTDVDGELVKNLVMHCKLKHNEFQIFR